MDLAKTIWLGGRLAQHQRLCPAQEIPCTDDVSRLTMCKSGGGSGDSDDGGVVGGASAMAVLCWSIACVCLAFETTSLRRAVHRSRTCVRRTMLFAALGSTASVYVFSLSLSFALLLLLLLSNYSQVLSLSLSPSPSHSDLLCSVCLPLYRAARLETLLVQQPWQPSYILALLPSYIITLTEPSL